MLGVVIVAYKNPELTADYINNQLPHIVNDKVTVVVNNGSSFEECEKLAGLCGGVACMPDDICGRHNVYIVCSRENLGFAKGNNLGVRFLMRNVSCEHILFSNNDIIIEPYTDLQPMIDMIEVDKSIGAIGPDIVGLDGHHQSPHMRVVTPYRQLGWLLFPRLRKKKKTGEADKDTVPPEGSCYWVSGSFFLIRFGHFSAVNGFDPDTFLYGEEPILAERLRRLGKRMYFYPGVRVIHLEGGTTSKNFKSSRLRNMIVESNCIYYKKYLRTPSIIVWLYRKLSVI